MIINITPDKEKAKSILEMIQIRERTLKKLNKNEDSTTMAEMYYEIIKELQTAILLIKGKKSIGKDSHKNLIQEISSQNIFSNHETSIIDDLRIRRNNSSYYGKQIPSAYLKTNETALKQIITKLKEKLKGII